MCKKRISKFLVGVLSVVVALTLMIPTFLYASETVPDETYEETIASNEGSNDEKENTGAEIAEDADFSDLNEKKDSLQNEVIEDSENGNNDIEENAIDSEEATTTFEKGSFEKESGDITTENIDNETSLADQAKTEDEATIDNKTGSDSESTIKDDEAEKANEDTDKKETETSTEKRNSIKKASKQSSSTTVSGLSKTDALSNTNIIQAALNTAKTASVSSPAKITIPSGTWPIRMLKIYSNTELILNGTLKRAYENNSDKNPMLYTFDDGNKQPGGYKRASNIKISGGTWDSDSSGKTYNSNVMHFAHASNITIENTTIKNCGASHSIILDGVKDAVINNVTFSNCIVEKSIHSSTRFVNEAIHIDSCSNSKDAASAEPFDHTNCQNIRITNNTFAGVTTAVGAHKHSDNSNKKDIHNNITISGNTFSNVAETCVNGVRINNLTVSDNQANTKAKLFIRLHATTNFKVSGNNVDGVDRFAYAYVTDDLKEVSNGTLSKNIVKNIAAKEVPDKNGSAFQAYGFAGKFTLDGENYSTSNNNRYLIFTSGSDVTLKNSILKGGSGIKLSSGKLTVTDNKIWDAKKAGLIAEKGGSNTIKNNIFMFKDVTDNGKYYFTPVYWAAKKGITSGYNDGSFGPAKNCTRAHVVTFLWRLAGKPNPKTKKNPFKDIKSNQYYYKAVLWASEKGITKGYSDGTFKPDATCLREHVVTFLWRYAGKPNPKAKTNPFNDVKSKDYFYKASIWANEKGVAKGYSSGQYKGGFGPHLNCLREHVVTFLYRYAK